MRETIRLYRGDFVRQEEYAPISVADGIAVDDESGHAVLIVPMKNDPGLGEIEEEFGFGEDCPICGRRPRLKTPSRCESWRSASTASAPTASTPSMSGNITDIFV